MRRLALVLVLALVPSILGAQEHQHPTGKTDKLGTVSFDVTCAAASKPKFERAVAMLHSFWFDAADTAFSEIATSDPNCALAYWGRAMTLMGNPMGRVMPPPERMRAGLELANKAKELSANASHREQMYADAAVAYYRD